MTPPEVFAAFGDTRFDLDPAWNAASFVPCDVGWDSRGLERKWSGLVWLNPPFGGRNHVRIWLEKFERHDNGIGLCRAQTSAAWFQRYVAKMPVVVFPSKKLRFYRTNGERGGDPGFGSVLFARGAGSDILSEAQLGWTIDQR